jgi:FtsH-binding integral membrane protein
MHMALSH